MMLMKNERCLIKKNIEKVVRMSVLGILIMVGIAFITGFYYERSASFKLEDVTVELGDKLPEKITSYIKLITDTSNLMIESDVPLDENGNTLIIGKFNYYLTNKDDYLRFSKLANVKSVINVVDTTKPVIKVKNDIKFEYDSDFDMDKVAECIDLSLCKMELSEEIDTSKSGEYTVTITASDTGGNTSTAEAKIKVLEKPRVVYYSAYSSDARISSLNTTIEEKNNLLSEEEKSNLRNSIVAFAKQFVGNPYVYGGTSLTNGTDCSGFTMSVYANFGYSIPRVVEGQAYIGKLVSASEALPGDLVVYSGHVGLYAGSGMMVHAGTPQTGIVYAPVYNAYHVFRRVIY
jgi:cell wall-associated NlpC family hydrolase